MAAYLANWWIRAGLVLVVFGWGPLLAIIVLATLGLWPDPNPNPIGPGLLFFLTCWPAIICLVVGVIRVQRKAAAGPPADAATSSPASARSAPASLAGSAWARLAALLGGAGLCLYGAATLTSDSSRGPAAAIVLGVVCIFWALTGRMPWWFRR
ncbi:hypothetical protein [Pseudoxanthomonas koreensis]|uniref:hypothetical protein n=1 Tax=Pseudoxanthomonas koreensis TaxID=266061 RepID=UPI0035A691F2